MKLDMSVLSVAYSGLHDLRLALSLQPSHLALLLNFQGKSQHSKKGKLCFCVAIETGLHRSHLEGSWALDFQESESMLWEPLARTSFSLPTLPLCDLLVLHVSASRPAQFLSALRSFKILCSFLSSHIPHVSHRII